jgi:arylsulfatase A-like enzyme
MPQEGGTSSPTARDVWALALTSGLVMGLGESAIFYAWRAFGVPQYVSIDIVWAAMMVDVAIALAVAGIGLLVSILRPSLRAHAPLAFLFLIWLNWTAVALRDRIHIAAIVLLALGLAVFSRDRLRGGRGGPFGLARRAFAPLAIVGFTAGALAWFGPGLRERWTLASLPEAQPGAPNVLVIVLDTFRGDHMSANGYGRATTPWIDAFAEGGTLFEDAYATSSYTFASHASILTGLLPHAHGAEWSREKDYLACECPTVGGVLQARGYATAGFSANPFWFTREYGFARGFHHFEDFFNTVGDAAFRTGYGRAVDKLLLPRLGYLDIPGRKSAAFQNGRFLRWLDGHRGRPFFAFVNYFDVHDPYLPPAPYRNRFNEGSVGGIINWRLNGIDPDLPASVISDEMDAYDGALTYLDEQIGKLLEELESQGVLENTLVVITSDHGEEFGEHGGLVMHGHSLYRQATHVPLVIRGPGVPAGVRVAASVTNAAIPATVASLLSVESEFPMTPLVNDGGASPDLPVMELIRKPWGSPRHKTTHGSGQAVVSEGWHLIRQETFPSELFDLSVDPSEQDDRIADPEEAGRVARMIELLEARSVLGEREGGR